MACRCNCDPCWICGSRPAAVALSRGGYEGACCQSFMGGTWAMAPLGSTGGELAWVDDVIHDTFGTANPATAYSFHASKDQCVAHWRFRPTTHTYLYTRYPDDIYADHIGPICEYYEEPGPGTGKIQRWLYIEAAEIRVTLGGAGKAAADAESSRLRVGVYTRFHHRWGFPLHEFGSYYRVEDYIIDFDHPCRELSGTYELGSDTVLAGPVGGALSSPSEAFSDADFTTPCAVSDDPLWTVEVEF